MIFQRYISVTKIVHFIVTLFLFCLTIYSLGQNKGRVLFDRDVLTGAEQTQVYLPLLDGKSVGVVANQTSMIDNTHLVDSLLALGVNVVRVFSPEHG